MASYSSGGSASKKAVLFTRCCDGDATAEELFDMYDHEREITFETFSRKVDMREFSEMLGYVYGRHAKGLRVKKDYHIRYYRAKFRGVPVYYVDWSSIDHIFVYPDQMEKVRIK